uniref:Uncharacterized protein n=1 Tax=uncultured marine thaumarchaeote SAT1000_10_C05 TaxID=1456372 RepID=A0A075I3Q3_9ARCH|nr:hypothetical protein [uncultured marine thaumarchaeote SAT1000_10_C05]
MNKKPIIGGIVLAAIIGVVFVGAEINPDNPENGEVWSIRMAGPEWDDRQTVRASLPNLEEGTYKLGFVPMGDSPTKIRIDIKVRSAGSDFAGTAWTPMFSEKFVLKGTPVDTGISKYYTWEYVGQKYVYIPEVEREANYEITITRTGNLKGSVSISLSR